MARIVLTMKERMPVLDLLREVLTPVGEGFNYPANWTDGRVAETVGGRVAPGHVAYLRASMFGKLVHAKPANNNDFDPLEDRVAALEEKFNKLVVALGGI
jgi:hypothetical protein